MSIIATHPRPLPPEHLPRWHEPHTCDDYACVVATATESTEQGLAVIEVRECQVCGQVAEDLDLEASDEQVAQVATAVAAYAPAVVDSPELDGQDVEQVLEVLRAASRQMEARYGYQRLAQALWGPSGQRPAWHAQAACRGTGARMDRTTAAGLALCEGCPVRSLCLDDGIEWERATGRTSIATTATVRGGVAATDRIRQYHNANTSTGVVVMSRTQIHDNTSQRFNVNSTGPASADAPAA